MKHLFAKFIPSALWLDHAQSCGENNLCTWGLYNGVSSMPVTTVIFQRILGPYLHHFAKNKAIRSLDMIQWVMALRQFLDTR